MTSQRLKQVYIFVCAMKFTCMLYSYCVIVMQLSDLCIKMNISFENRQIPN